ncbi:transposase [Thermodesulfobacteriota bacterium]
MPRQPRLDTPGALHHVIGRGIDGIDIFDDKKDWIDFLARLKDLCESKAMSVYAWSLMSNHYHLLVRTGNISLSDNMRKLLTGYVVNYNRRHKRYGYLFQNRYKSILCEDDPYLLELTRYIHLNPLRAGIVKSIKELNKYPRSGHSVIMGSVKHEWQDSETILSYFGKWKKKAIGKYEDFIIGGIKEGNRPELVGGGLIRSLGGWSQVKSLRRAGSKIYSDERILGSSEFVKDAITDVEEKIMTTLRINNKITDLYSLSEKICSNKEVIKEELLNGSKKRIVVKYRKIFCQIAVKEMGYSGAEVARFLGVTTSAVNRAASSNKLSEVENYI